MNGRSEEATREDGAQPTPTNASKLLGLEALRFVAALAVLFWHYQHFGFLDGQPVPFEREQQPLYHMFAALYDRGHYGVQVFWCISGFIFFLRYREAITRHRISIARFFVLRFSRLYPLHLATLLFVAVCQLVYVRMLGHYFVYQPNDLRHFAMQLLMASNWGFEDGLSFNGPIWSISLEVLVYISFFIALRTLGGSVVVNVVVVTSCMALTLVGHGVPLLDAIAFFYAGGIAAIAMQESTGRLGGFRIRQTAWALALLLPVSWTIPEYGTQPHADFLFLILWTPALLLVLPHGVGAGKVLQKKIEQLGSLTYASYLVHFPLQLVLALGAAWSGTPLPVRQPPFLFAYIALTLVLAHLANQHLEVPVQALLRRERHRGDVTG